jgi:dipeptidyl aminopeptidase/acylaminoacyl peptidase
MRRWENRDRGRKRSRVRVQWAALGVLVVLAVAVAQAAAGAPAATRWIVFSALPNGLPPAQLFRIQTTGDGLQQITKGKIPATEPAFSPNGKRVVFARLGSGIFVMNLDGSGLRRLTSGAHDTFPVWSPDSTRIAFLRQYKSEWRLHVMKASGEALRRLSLAPPAGRPSWTADGKSIFMPAQGALEKVDASTGRSRKHIVLKLDLPTPTTLSPNARKAAFVGPRPSIPGCGEVSCVVFALYLVDVPHARTQRFVNDAGPAGWSPDSKALAFAYRGKIALWPVAGGNRALLTTDTNVVQADAPPAWQPR